MKKLQPRFIQALAIIISFFAGLTQLGAQTPSGIPGEMPISYDVSASGAFQYSLPLKLPPGIKDMVPGLAISYSSQSGNGNLGVGWTLGGLSAITRGMPTIFHHANIQPVGVGLGDVLFLDGQQMNRTSTGSSVFLTEIKNFAKIEEHGTAGAGPSYFIVEYPSGLTYQYGNTISSKMLAQGKSEVLMWAVNKIEDKYGNYIEFEYSNQQSIGEYKITKITYSANSNTGNDNHVTINFTYTPRDDKNAAWVNGSRISSNELLDQIIIKFSDNSIASQYEFEYNANNISRLVTIQETLGGFGTQSPIKLPPVNITWGEDADEVSFKLITLSNHGSTIHSVGDFNGDGFPDYIEKEDTNSYVFINDGTGNYNEITTARKLSLQYNTISTWGPRNNRASRSKTSRGGMYFDYDGDGMDDIIVIDMFEKGSYNRFTQLIAVAPYYEIWLYRANGNTATIFDEKILLTSQASIGASNKNDHFNGLSHFQAGDFDGDSKTEIFIAHPYNFHTLTSVEDYEFLIVGDEYGAHQIEHFGYGHIDGTMILDYNGDGKDEFLVTHKLLGTTASSFLYGLKVGYNTTTLKPELIQTSTNWPTYHYSTSQWPHTYLQNFIGDFNGDGNDDMLSWSTNSPHSWFLHYSNATYNHYLNSSDMMLSATGWSNWPLPNLSPSGPTVGSNYSVHIGDFNGDGLEDILQLQYSPTTQTTTYTMYYSKGIMNFLEKTGVFPGFAGYDMNTLGDFNGDGQIDILQKTGKLISFDENNLSLKVTSIEHAGKYLDVTYKMLTHDQDFVRSIINNDHYSNKILPVKIVKELSDRIDVDNKYIYGGLVHHKYGLGFRGFETFTIENIAGQKTFNKYEVATHIPWLKETRIFDGISCGTYTYDSDNFGKRIKYAFHNNTGGAGGLSRIIYHYEREVLDYVNGDAKFNTVNLGNTLPGSVYYDYGKIAHMNVYNMGAWMYQEQTEYSYDLNAPFINRGKPVSVTTRATNVSIPYARTTNYTYNGTTGDVLTEKTDPGTVNEKTTTFSYEPIYGNVSGTSLVAVNIPGNITTAVTYTSDGRFVTSTTNPLLYVTTNDYGTSTNKSWGNVLKRTSHNGLETEYTYDMLNRVIKAKDVTSGVETHTNYAWAIHDQHSNNLANVHIAVRTEVIGMGGGPTTIYDKYNRVVRVARDITGHGITHTDKTYNQKGLLVSSTSPYRMWEPQNAVVTTYDYDCFNRLIETNVSDGGPTSLISYSHHYQANQISMRKTVHNLATGKKVRTEYSPSRLTMIEDISDGDVETIEYWYHHSGQVSKIITNGNETIFGLDDFARTVSKNEPNVGNTTYQYNSLDRLTTETLPDGTSFGYTYDKLGRVRTKSINGLAPYDYIYNNTNSQPSTGELAQVTAPNGSAVSYTYNNRGELITVQETTDPSNIFTTQYTYDNFGQKQTQTYPSGDMITYHYTPNNHYLESISLTNSPLGMPHGITPQTIWKTQTTDVLGRPTEVFNFDNQGIEVYRTFYTYDKHGYLLNQNSDASGALIADMTYDYNVATGQLQSRTDNLNNRGFTELFTYDEPNDRLTHTQYIGSLASGVNIDYDIHGNILKKSDVSNSAYDWKYDKYALIQVPEPQTSNPAFEIPMNTQYTTYEPFMKVSTIIEEDANKFVFTYGPEQERIKCEYYDMPGSIHTKTKFYATNYEKTVDATTGDVEHISYIWGGGKPVAMLRHKVSAMPMNSTSEINHILTDYQGSITHILDNVGIMPSNGVLEERSYDAWGRVRDADTWVPFTSNQPLNWSIDRGYTGHEHIFSANWNNNVINMNGRLYDPLVGRMFSPDPVIPDGNNSQDYNKYSYARNNPLKYSDPSGNIPVATLVALNCLAGGLVNLGANAGNINSFGDGLMYFSIGATSAFAGWGVGSVISVGGVGSAMAGGATGGFLGGAGNAWVGGAGLGQGFLAGGQSGIAGATSAGAMAVMGNYLAVKNSAISSLKGGKASGNMQDYINEAASYNTSSEQATNDVALNNQMNSEFNMQDPALAASDVTTRVPSNWGLTEDGIYVDPEKNLVYGYTEHTAMGYNNYHISPHALKFAGTSHHHIFTAIAGHELVHGYQWTALGSPRTRGARAAYNYWQANSKYSEIAAWRYSYNVFMRAGDLINASMAADRINFYGGNASHSPVLLHSPKLK